MQFKSRSAAVEFLVENLAPPAEQVSAYRELLDLLADDAFREVDLSAAGGGRRSKDHIGLMVPQYRWVVKDDDLSLLSLVVEHGFGVGGGMAAGGVTGALIGAAAAIFLRLQSLWRDGVKVDGVQLRILASLKASRDGMTGAELVARLNRTGKDKTWDLKRVQEQLDKLQKMRKKNGSIADLVSVDHSGRWVAAV